MYLLKIFKCNFYFFYSETTQEIRGLKRDRFFKILVVFLKAGKPAFKELAVSARFSPGVFLLFNIIKFKNF